jgi:hypothetical protein
MALKAAVLSGGAGPRLHPTTLSGVEATKFGSPRAPPFSEYCPEACSGRLRCDGRERHQVWRLSMRYSSDVSRGRLARVQHVHQ